MPAAPVYTPVATRPRPAPTPDSVFRDLANACQPGLTWILCREKARFDACGNAWNDGDRPDATECRRGSNNGHNN
jgi:hypothetical protein